MNRHKNILILFMLTVTLSCVEDEYVKRYEELLYRKANESITDTVTLSDGHLYYFICTHCGKQPIHSQYCKKHDDEQNR